MEERWGGRGSNNVGEKVGLRNEEEWKDGEEEGCECESSFELNRANISPAFVSFRVGCEWWMNGKSLTTAAKHRQSVSVCLVGRPLFVLLFEERGWVALLLSYYILLHFSSLAHIFFLFVFLSFLFSLLVLICFAPHCRCGWSFLLLLMLLLLLNVEGVFVFTSRYLSA